MELFRDWIIFIILEFQYQKGEHTHTSNENEHRSTGQDSCQDVTGVTELKKLNNNIINNNTMHQ